MYRYVKFARESKTLDEGISYVIEKTGIPRTIIEQVAPFNSSYQFSKRTTIEMAVSSNTKGYFICLNAFDSDGINKNSSGSLFSADGRIIDSGQVIESSYYLQIISSMAYDASKTYTLIPLIISGFGLFESMYTFPLLDSRFLINVNNYTVINGMKYRVCQACEYAVNPLRSVAYPITE